MLDFMKISTRTKKSGGVEIYPKFKIMRSKDLMIRGKDFYAIWDEDKQLWSTDEQDVIRLIDRELKAYTDKKYEGVESGYDVLYMWDAETGMIDRWHKYCQQQMRDSYVMLDEKLIFSNTETKKEDYASKRLNYPLVAGDTPGFDKLISTLYSEEARHKIEWAIGAILSGDSKTIQKFMVLYGEGGTGKSTILNIIQQLFDGYYTVFDAKALGSAGSQFALEAFKTNPLVAIQHDGDLSKIEDNTRINSLVSHEEMTVNEKYKGTYTNRFKCFLFMGTNKPVKITDAKSGIIRRLIDVSPSGNKLNPAEYQRIMKQIPFELGGIAQHCLDVYLADPGAYDNYIPIEMMGASNDFYNFILDSYHVFKKEDGTTLNAAWEMYKTYCEDAKVPFPFSKRNFKEELKTYFWDFDDRFTLDDGSRVRSYYRRFRTDKFEVDREPVKEKEQPKLNLIEFKAQKSIFDEVCADCPAQYATSKGIPTQKWDNTTTKLSDLDTSKLHFVKVPENHIVIDFDIRGANGEKSYEQNLEAASKWPATYAELSKSGGGIHLHYIYTGDPEKLSRVYDQNIEVKVFTGNSSLRRLLTKCNDLPIATINSGLPLKGDKDVINFEGVANENVIRTMIKRNLNKEIHASTRCSIDFIYKILQDAYDGGARYDVTDMYDAVLAFAASSTNQSDYCIRLVSKMQFKSEDPSDFVFNDEAPIVFYDVEVFPNLFLVNWKIQGKGKPVVRMINPKPNEIEEILKFRLVGFNNRNYDNHMLYGCLLGYNNEQLYDLSTRLVNDDDPQIKRDAQFGEAFNISYTDVYDFSVDKKGLKKWEIELGSISEDTLREKGFTEDEIDIIKAGTHHQELGLPWNKPVPKELWNKVAEYCDNDVIATESVFVYRKGDFIARQIQVDLVKIMHGITRSVNDTTNTLSKRIMFGSNRKPQSEFNYRDLSQPVSYKEYDDYRRRFGDEYVFRVFDDKGIPQYRDYIPGEVLPDGWSIMPFFPEYVFEYGVSTYMGIELGEGGGVYAEPGLYSDVWDGDIASQHPHSIIFEMLFGPKFTKIFKEIVQARVAVKHKDFETAGKLLNGALKPYLSEELAADLAQALKIIINSIYGLTAAKFANEFRDPRNKDNIVAKRGALFMMLLKREVQKRGFTVCHIKTDSIKIPNATPDIIEFVTAFGKEFGYTFETEANFSRFGIVNDAVYVARYADGKKAGEWTATGAQFAVPYVFKTIFSKEPIEFDDLCETRAVKSSLYLDMNEDLPDVDGYEKELTNRLFNEFRDDDKKPKRLNPDFTDISTEDLRGRIAEGHDYHFVGRVGRFCPIKPGCGGGMLYRDGIDKYGDVKYSSVAGTKDNRWLESEMVKELGKEDDIDISYYNKLVDDAIDKLSEFGDFEWFISDNSDTDISEPEVTRYLFDLPWKAACGKDNCHGCLDFDPDGEQTCKLGYDNSDFASL